MRIYVAGPMRRYKRLNFPVFERVTDELRRLGHEVISPAEEDLKEGFDPDNPGEFTKGRYEAWMARDFEFIRSCDAIFMLRGWEESPGANREYGYALGLGKKILLWSEQPWYGPDLAGEPDTPALYYEA